MSENKNYATDQSSQESKSVGNGIKSVISKITAKLSSKKNLTIAIACGLAAVIATVVICVCIGSNKPEGICDAGHTDADFNGACDVCKEIICQDHKDSDGDKVCEACGEKALPKTGNKEGNLCPTANLNLIGSDEKINISNYRGKVVVINFWGTWCGPCKSELPHFSEVAEEMADDVVVIAVHTSYYTDTNPLNYINENFENSKMFFAYDSAMGSTEMYYNLLGGDRSYPYTVVLDTDGVIKAKITGALSRDNLEALIELAK